MAGKRKLNRKAMAELSGETLGLLVPEPGVVYECDWKEESGRCALAIFGRDRGCIPKRWCFEPGKDGVRWRHEGNWPGV